MRPRPNSRNNEPTVGSLTALTEANLRKHGGPGREEQESALLERMQTLSNLLGQVNDALDAEPPSTAASSRPPSSRPPPSRGQQQILSRPHSRAPDGNERPLLAAIARRYGGDSLPRGSARLPEPPQLAVIHDDEPPPKPLAEAAPQLVNYTGNQTHVPLNKGRRKISEASAARSEASSVIYGDNERDERFLWSPR